MEILLRLCNLKNLFNSRTHCMPAFLSNDKENSAAVIAYFENVLVPYLNRLVREGGGVLRDVDTTAMSQLPWFKAQSAVVHVEGELQDIKFTIEPKGSGDLKFVLEMQYERTAAARTWPRGPRGFRPRGGPEDA